MDMDVVVQIVWRGVFVRILRVSRSARDTSNKALCLKQPGKLFRDLRERNWWVGTTPPESSTHN